MKKTMIKAVTLILSIALLGACQSQPQNTQNPKDVLKAAVEKTNEADSLTLEMEMKISMKAEDDTFEMPTTTTIEIQGIRDNNLIYHMNSAMNAFGEEVNVDMWYFDGVMYVDTMDEKTAMKIDLDSAKSKINSEVKMFDSLSDYQAKEDANGNITSVSVKISKEQLLELMNSTDSEMIDEDILDSLENIQINELTYQINAQGYVSGMEFGIQAESEGVSMSIQVTCTYSKLNETVVEKIDISGFKVLDFED